MEPPSPPEFPMDIEAVANSDLNEASTVDGTTHLFMASENGDLDMV